jgi:hypothetical protein
MTPVIEKEIPEYCEVDAALTEVIASLKEPVPESLVLLTT